MQLWVLTIFVHVSFLTFKFFGELRAHLVNFTRYLTLLAPTLQNLPGAIHKDRDDKALSNAKR